VWQYLESHAILLSILSASRTSRAGNQIDVKDGSDVTQLLLREVDSPLKEKLVHRHKEQAGGRRAVQ
jgi:hypothetical protein